MSISQMDFFNVLWGAMCNYQNNLDQVLHPNMTVNLTQNFNDTSVDFVCIIINFDVGIFWFTGAFAPACMGRLWQSFPFPPRLHRRISTSARCVCAAKRSTSCQSFRTRKFIVPSLYVEWWSDWVHSYTYTVDSYTVDSYTVDPYTVDSYTTGPTGGVCVFACLCNNRVLALNCTGWCAPAVSQWVRLPMELCQQLCGKRAGRYLHLHQRIEWRRLEITSSYAQWYRVDFLYC